MTIVGRGLGVDIDVNGALAAGGLTIRQLIIVPATGKIPFCLGPFTNHIEGLLSGTQPLRPFTSSYAEDVDATLRR